MIQRVAIGALFAGSSIFAVSGAFAQASDAVDASATARPAGNTTVDEIIVTAQRRSQGLTSVPLSISAISAKELDQTGIKDIDKLAYTTPGFIASEGAGYTQIYLRGIGNAIFVGADPSVATFVDDTPRIYGTLINSFIDVERVEVLKGAQGGLYGRNATGGVVNIITRQPGDELAAQLRGSLGSYETRDASGYINLPITKQLAASLTVTREYHGPYVKNLATRDPYPAGTLIFGVDANAPVKPGRLNDEDLWSVGGKLRLKPVDRVTITLAGDYTKKDDAASLTYLQGNPVGAYAAYSFLAQAFGFTPLPGPFPTKDGKFSSYQPYRARNVIEDYGASGRVEVGLPSVDLTSITSLRWNNVRFTNDNHSLPVPFIEPNVVRSNKHNIYQELRAVSTGSGPFRFLGGATYLRDHFDEVIEILLFGIVPTTAAPTTSTTITKAWSIYGQGEYDLTDRLTLTGSLRYVHEKKSIQFDFPASPGTALVGKKLLPAVTLSYKADGGTIYGRYAKGYKTGGINPLAPPSAFPGGIGSSFGPELVNTYEVGYRAPLFDRTVQFTSAVFYNDYKGLQVSGTALDSTILLSLVNAGSARTYGAEASATWRVSQPLTISAGLGYLNARYKTFVIDSPALVSADYSRQRMPYAPKWQGNISANLDQPISSKLRLVGTVLWSYVSALNFDVSLSPFTAQKRYSLVNGRIGVVTTNDRVGVYLFGNNVFNKEYFTFGSPVNSGSIFGDPRVVGGTVELKF